MGFYSKRHYQMVGGNRSSTPFEIAERAARKLAGEMANAEMMAKFSPMTADNALEAVEFQAKRIAEIMGEWYIAHGMKANGER